jgi:hypothetical protein
MYAHKTVLPTPGSDASPLRAPAASQPGQGQLVFPMRSATSCKVAVKIAGPASGAGGGPAGSTSATARTSPWGSGWPSANSWNATGRCRFREPGQVLRDAPEGPRDVGQATVHVQAGQEAAQRPSVEGVHRPPFRPLAATLGRLASQRSSSCRSHRLRCPHINACSIKYHAAMIRSIVSPMPP